MGEEETKKSDPRGGIRTPVRHGAQALTASGGLTGILEGLVYAGKITHQEAFVAFAIAMPVLTTAWKVWDGLDGTARLKAKLNKIAPLTVVMLAASGCALQLGTSNPKQFAGLQGETIIACEVKGISIAWGDADICRNTEGGHVSKMFADMFLGTIKTAGAIIGGFFSGLGSAGDGIQAALAPVPEATVEPPRMPPGTVVEPSAPTPDAPDSFSNPFGWSLDTAPAVVDLN